MELGYEIKYVKHIAFKHKDKERFIRAKIIIEDYTEDSLKKRISENSNQKTLVVKKRVGNVIGIAKAESSNGYKSKHNPQELQIRLF